MFVAVPRGVGLDVGEAEVGREIDDLEPRGQRRDDALRGAVGQRAEDHVDIVVSRILERDQPGQLEPAQMGKHLGHGAARAALGGKQADRDVGMAREQADELRPRIAAGPENCRVDGLRRHGPVLSPSG